MSHTSSPLQNYNYVAITKNNGLALVIIDVFYAHSGGGITVEPPAHKTLPR